MDDIFETMEIYYIIHSKNPNKVIGRNTTVMAQLTSGSSRSCIKPVIGQDLKSGEHYLYDDANQVLLDYQALPYILETRLQVKTCFFSRVNDPACVSALSAS